MKKTGALASALRSSGATVPASVANDVPTIRPEPVTESKPQPSRHGTKPITVHYPEEVRRQLKMLAAEQGRDQEDMVAEALNLLFVKYRKAEVAPRKAKK